jgi:hypothetical protein
MTYCHVAGETAHSNPGWSALFSGVKDNGKAWHYILHYFVFVGSLILVNNRLQIASCVTQMRLYSKSGARPTPQTLNMNNKIVQVELTSSIFLGVAEGLVS